MYLEALPRYDLSQLHGDEIHIKSGTSFSEVVLHWHDYYELIFYFDADVLCEINGNSMRFGGNSLYLLIPFDFHKTTNLLSDGKISFVNISFSATALDNTLLAKINNALLMQSINPNGAVRRIINILNDDRTSLGAQNKKCC